MVCEFNSVASWLFSELIESKRQVNVHILMADHALSLNRQSETESGMNETIGVAHTCEHEWHLFVQKSKYFALNRFSMHHCLSSNFVALPKAVTQVIKISA